MQIDFMEARNKLGRKLLWCLIIQLISLIDYVKLDLPRRVRKKDWLR